MDDPAPETFNLDTTLKGDYSSCYAVMFSHAKKLERERNYYRDVLDELCPRVPKIPTTL